MANNWYPWLVWGLFVAGSLALLLVWNNARSRRRDSAIQRFLDTADALEQDLHACRKRMQDMHDWVSKLPGETSKIASSSLNPQTTVTAALKQVLSQRLWLRESVDSASVAQIQAAEANMDRSRQSLAEHMNKLDSMREALERATDQLDDAHRNIDKSLSVMVGGISHTIH